MAEVETIIEKTHQAAVALRSASDKTIKHALLLLADAVEANTKNIIKANQKDLAVKDPADPKTDRLMLNEQRIHHIAQSIRNIGLLPNPAGQLLLKKTLANGLKLEKRAVPLGVVGAIYESRPNVTFDIAALCLRSQNAALLKGSSDAAHTNLAAINIIQKSLKQSGLPADCISLLPADRAAVMPLLQATRYVDVIIPRGSENLIQFVRQNSRIPVIETGAGVCHIYVEATAQLSKAINIVVNAKVSRPSVCNAMDTLLVDAAIAPQLLPQLATRFEQYGVEIFADAKAFKLLKSYSSKQAATEEDYAREFLDLKCAIRVVKNTDEALAHISKYSTKHSEAIVSTDKHKIARFIEEVDAAAVYANASTRFTDGEVFGLGAEIGISTQKLHARGPFALEKLVTEKWIVKGTGQVRN